MMEVKEAEVRLGLLVKQWGSLSSGSRVWRIVARMDTFALISIVHVLDWGNFQTSGWYPMTCIEAGVISKHLDGIR